MAFDYGGWVVALALDLIARLAVLMMAVASYPLVRRLLDRPPRRGDELTLGSLLGVGAGIAMLLPVHVGALGAGLAGIGVAGLLGSPVGAGLAATLGVLAFSMMEPPGTLPGLTALLASAALGRLLARLAERQQRTAGPFDLGVLGAVLAFAAGVAHAGLANAALAGIGATTAGALLLQAPRRRADRA